VSQRPQQTDNPAIAQPIIQDLDDMLPASDSNDEPDSTRSIAIKLHQMIQHLLLQLPQLDLGYELVACSVRLCVNDIKG
jgi:hypothetical protein